MANIKTNCDKMEAEKDNKKATPTTNNTDLTSALRDGKDAEGPSLAQNAQGNEAPKEKKTDEGEHKQEQVPLLNKTPKEEREEEAQKQEKKQQLEQIPQQWF